MICKLSSRYFSGMLHLWFGEGHTGHTEMAESLSKQNWIVGYLVLILLMLLFVELQ